MIDYKKLAESGAIHTSFKAKLTPLDTDFALLVDAAFQLAMSDGHLMHYPTKSFGPDSLTLCDAYIRELENLGFDEIKLRAKANELKDRHDAHISLRKAKAAALFKLIQTEWTVEEHEIEKYIDSESIYDFLELVLEHADSTRARLKAIKKHATDPKQADKTLVRECWAAWQKEPERYEGKADFARDMRDKFPNLKSQPVIEGWCRKWEREDELRWHST
jgi:hypothetical protein